MRARDAHRGVFLAGAVASPTGSTVTLARASVKEARRGLSNLYGYMEVGEIFLREAVQLSQARSAVELSEEVLQALVPMLAKPGAMPADSTW